MTKNNVIPGKKYRFFNDPILCCWLFSALLVCLCLAVAYFSYHSYRTENIKEYVERMSLDLLGFIEFDADQQLSVPDEARPGANRFLYDIVGARGNQGLAYIWSETDNAVVWPLDERWDNNQSAEQGGQLDEIKAQHVALIRKHLKSQGLYDDEAGFQLPRAVPITIPSQQYYAKNTYMTSGQLFRLNANDGDDVKTNNYLYVVAKSMRAIEDDVSFLAGLGWRFLLLFNVLFAVDWLICRFVVKPRRRTG